MERLEGALNDLLTNGYDGGFLIIEHTTSNKFLQFSKYVINRKNSGIEFGFPEAKWSIEYYKKLKIHCEKNEIEYREETPKEKNGLQFINIDFGDNVKEAYRFVQFFLSDIFNLSEDEEFYVRLR